MNDLLSFGDRLRHAREESGLSQAKLARLIYSTKMSILRWEQGIHQPTADDIAALCRVLNVSADWMLGLTDKKKSAQSAGTLKGADEKTS